MAVLAYAADHLFQRIVHKHPFDPLKAVWKCEAKLVFAAIKPLQIAP
jgi:hypothetical protein